MASGIYKITLINDGRSYVGSTKDIDQRWREHRANLAGNRHHSTYLQNAYNKYGDQAFSYDIVELIQIHADLSSDEIVNLLIPREQWWIDNSDSQFNMNPIAGSCLGRIHSEETKAKISAAHLGRKMPPMHGEKQRQRRLGTKTSEETRAKMSAAHIGRKHTAESIAKMSEIQKASTTSYRFAAGEDHHLSKLSEDDVRMIRKLRDDGATYELLGSTFGINPTTASSIARRKTWKHV